MPQQGSDQHCGHQHINQHVIELCQQPQPHGTRFAARKQIRSVFLQPPVYLLSTQPFRRHPKS